MQLDRADRGFSFSADGPLDMRMEKSGLTAADFLNEADEAEIARVLRDYGEEPRARAIARAIVANRPIERTAELAAIVRRAARLSPGPEERSGDPHLPGDPHPPECRARRAREAGLPRPSASLKPGGRLAVVTFHSLEDRIVKRFFRERSGATPAGSRHRPVAVQGPAPTFETGRQAGQPDGGRDRAQSARRARRGCAARVRTVGAGVAETAGDRK